MQQTRSSSGGQTRLGGLQVLRAVAATFVLVQHVGVDAGALVGANLDGFYKLQFGFYGVIIFFAISGAVMALATSRDGPLKFAVSRVSRIYPPYFAALLLAAAILALPGAPGVTPTADLSLLLFPSGTLNSSFQVPYWTLIYEMFFYFLLLCCAAAGLNLRTRAWLAVAWVAAILGASAAGWVVPTANPILLQIALSPINIYFAIGYAVGAGVLLKDAKPLAAMLVVAAFSVLNFSAWNVVFLAYSVLVGGVVYLLVVLPIKWPRPLTRAGDYSYGLYLIHLPLIAAISVPLRILEARLWPAAIAMFLVGGLGGLLFGFVEHSVYSRWIKPFAHRFVSEPAAGGEAPPQER